MFAVYIIVSNPFNGYVFISEPFDNLNIDQAANHLAKINPKHYISMRSYKLLLVKNLPDNKFKMANKPDGYPWYIFNTLNELDEEINRIAV